MKNKQGSLLIFGGLLLMAAALSLMAYNLYDEYKAQESSAEAVGTLEEFLLESIGEDSGQLETAGGQLAGDAEIQVPGYILNPEMEMPTQTIKGREYIGVLDIPVVKLHLPIISTWSYPNLKAAPCRYGGSAYTNSLIIAGHNYLSHFAKLKSLGIGEKVFFTDMEGTVFRYEVVELETLKPTAVDEMTSGEWDLTLFTCTYGGSYRMTVRCERTDEVAIT